MVKLIGDGTLVEFGCVVDAVKCALAIQRAVKAAAWPDGGGIVLRIGIHRGDVIIAWLVREHRSDDTPFVGAEFIA